MPSGDGGPTSRSRLASGAPARLARAQLLALTCTLLGCQPKLVVGEWTCPASDAAAPSKTDAITVPWSTSFENRFCDYTQLAGFCFADALASYETVSAPVHSGAFAAAFNVTTVDPSGGQTRCVRQGVLPTAAYYGAWYYVPALATNSALWNLIHFQGGDPSGQHYLWDVSLANTASGDLQLTVYDFLANGGLGMVRRPVSPPPIPIATWFHLQFYLKRAADATGEIKLYQDGQLLLDVSAVVTDDSTWGQWYVGNLATGLMPAESTLYVDDVSIDASL